MDVEQPESRLVLQSQDAKRSRLVLQSQDEGLVLQSEDAKRPVIEIAFKSGMWWSLPQGMSQMLYDKYVANETNIGYTWDWGQSRLGSWSPEGEQTSTNRYTHDFTCMEQTNIDNNRKRFFRIDWVLLHQIEAYWTGQLVVE
jgi:hypothetical protein